MLYNKSALDSSISVKIVVNCAYGTPPTFYTKLKTLEITEKVSGSKGFCYF